MPRIKIGMARNSGNRIGWMKHVTSVDTTKTNGYAFDGDFIPNDTEFEIPAGAIVVACNPEGSVKNNWKSGHIYRVESDGSLTPIESDFNWRKEFLTLRDKVAELVNKEKPNPLTKYSDIEIMKEAKRRHLI